ncbi:hypothetical protein [Allopontixanthobacter sediminis]|uniref:Uncharacterized protein n=1 Tax=Allopontixanthobacter sediminis TaxID=1689985 RepID=A0A845AY83_9SPHN|nr:hypothetical protein [Allopontixanthobacter sediminis]MXP42886.1 hypothetical protein [Allopontixanthobacter sediminis]
MSRNDYRNSTDLLTPTLALAIWAAHFSLVWAASSIFPDMPAARWIAVLLTIAALAGLVWLWRRSGVRSPTSIPGLGIAIAAAGIAFDLLPALFG